MRLILMAFVAVLAGSAFALADTAVSPAEAEKQASKCFPLEHPFPNGVHQSACTIRAGNA
ncbi:MAG: hypothetical protein ACXVK3_18425 [Candidatus Angelobacter sp.]